MNAKIFDSNPVNSVLDCSFLPTKKKTRNPNDVFCIFRSLLCSYFNEYIESFNQSSKRDVIKLHLVVVSKLTSYDVCLHSYSGVKVLVCLFVNSCLGVGAKSFSVFEQRGVGVQWSNIGKSPSADDDFSLGQVFLMFIVEIIIYGFFAW